MSIRMKLAFSCYFLSGVLLVGFGLVYMFRAEFMPYHAVAVGMSWAEVPPQFQVLILALMKGVGAHAWRWRWRFTRSCLCLSARVRGGHCGPRHL